MVYAKGSKSKQAVTYYGFATSGHLLGLDVEIARGDVVPVSRVLSSGIFSAGLGVVSIGPTPTPWNNLKNSLRYRILSPTKRQGFIAGLVWPIRFIVTLVTNERRA